MTTATVDTKNAMEKMHDDATELHMLLGVVMQWINNNREQVMNSSPATKVPENAKECLEKSEAIKLWARGNLDMERASVSKSEAIQVRNFAKSLRSLVRGTAQSYNSLAFSYMSLYGGRTVKRTFAEAATLSARLSHTVNTLDSH